METLLAESLINSYLLLPILQSFKYASPLSLCIYKVESMTYMYIGIKTIDPTNSH